MSKVNPKTYVQQPETPNYAISIGRAPWPSNPIKTFLSCRTIKRKNSAIAMILCIH